MSNSEAEEILEILPRLTQSKSFLFRFRLNPFSGQVHYFFFFFFSLLLHILYTAVAFFSYKKRQHWRWAPFCLLTIVKPTRKSSLVTLYKRGRPYAESFQQNGQQLGMSFLGRWRGGGGGSVPFMRQMD